jgi:hypothetical protein
MRRRRRAVPPVLESARGSLTFALVVTAFAAVCLLLYSYLKWSVWLLVAVPALALMVVMTAMSVYERVLLFIAYLTLARRGVRCVVIYSQSPVWHEHIAQQWLPRLGARARTLDWSRRARWQRSVEVALFEKFCGTTNFNPAVIVFRGLRRPYVFRFFHAFHQAKRGRVAYLRHLEDDLFVRVLN